MNSILREHRAEEISRLFAGAETVDQRDRDEWTKLATWYEGWDGIPRFFARLSPTGAASIAGGQGLPAKAFHGLAGLCCPEVGAAIETEGLTAEYTRRDIGEANREGFAFGSAGFNAVGTVEIPIEAVRAAACEALAKCAPSQTCAIEDLRALLAALEVG